VCLRQSADPAGTQAQVEIRASVFAAKEQQ
jgi:hypothetical protein